jgi:hypothetical protein
MEAPYADSAARRAQQRPKATAYQPTAPAGGWPHWRHAGSSHTRGGQALATPSALATAGTGHLAGGLGRAVAADAPGLRPGLAAGRALAGGGGGWRRAGPGAPAGQPLAAPVHGGRVSGVRRAWRCGCAAGLGLAAAHGPAAGSLPVAGLARCAAVSHPARRPGWPACSAAAGRRRAGAGRRLRPGPRPARTAPRLAAGPAGRGGVELATAAGVRAAVPLGRVRRGDMWAMSWQGCQVVYLFQRPESMARAWDKACADLAPGAGW